jgi:hypothetical protein
MEDNYKYTTTFLGSAFCFTLSESVFLTSFTTNMVWGKKVEYNVFQGELKILALLKKLHITFKRITYVIYMLFLSLTWVLQPM